MALQSSRIPAATHLQMLKANGALKFNTARGSLWAIYDAEFVLAQTAPEIEGVAPALTCRTADIEQLQIGKDTLIERDDFRMKVKTVIHDGAGETVLVLKQ